MFEYNPIDSKNYYPKFINFMNHDQLKEFSEAVNDKIRKVQLNLTKIEQNNAKIKNSEKKEPKIIMNYSYDKKKQYKINNLKFPAISRKKNGIKEIFETYKNDFDSKINDLKYMFESSTLYQKYTSLNENKKSNKKRNRKYNLTIDNVSDNKKSSNAKLLPYINKGKNY
jgi:hypothetical protein